VKTVCIYARDASRDVSWDSSLAFVDGIDFPFQLSLAGQPAMGCKQEYRFNPSPFEKMQMLGFLPLCCELFFYLTGPFRRTAVENSPEYKHDA
jgi:hypothetical protein